MRLNISLNKKHPGLDRFIIEWLIPSLRNMLKAKIHKNRARLQNYNHIIPQSELYSNLILAAENIIFQHKNSSEDLLITINPNEVNYKNTAKLYDICALVNFGSIDCPALPIFTEVFNYFANNFWQFFNDYKVGILPCP